MLIEASRALISSSPNGPQGQIKANAPPESLESGAGDEQRVGWRGRISRLRKRQVAKIGGWKAGCVRF
jgi:hypothetical protein